MKDVTLWNLWYAALVGLPLVMTRMLIKHAMVRAVERRRARSSIDRRS